MITLAPLLTFPFLDQLTEAAWPGAACVLAGAWGLVRLIRDRALSRVALVSVIGPLSAGATVMAAAGILSLLGYFGISPDGFLDSLVGHGSLGAAIGGVALVSSRWVARRSRADARLFLYLQALPSVALLCSIPTNGWWAAVPWASLTAAAWAAAVARYLTGGADVAERLGRRLRAWVSGAMLLFMVAALAGAAAKPAVASLIAVVALAAPLLWVDARLDAEAPSRANLLPSEDA